MQAVLSKLQDAIIRRNGLEMLVAQALYAVEFFLEKKLDEAEIDKVYKKIYTDKLAEQEK